MTKDNENQNTRSQTSTSQAAKPKALVKALVNSD